MSEMCLGRHRITPVSIPYISRRFIHLPSFLPQTLVVTGSQPLGTLGTRSGESHCDCFNLVLATRGSMCHLVPHCLVLPEIGGGHQQDGLIHQSETVMLVDIILRTQFVTCSDAHRFRPTV